MWCECYCDSFIFIYHVPLLKSSKNRHNTTCIRVFRILLFRFSQWTTGDLRLEKCRYILIGCWAIHVAATQTTLPLQHLQQGRYDGCTVLNLSACWVKAAYTGSVYQQSVKRHHSTEQTHLNHHPFMTPLRERCPVGTSSMENIRKPKKRRAALACHKHPFRFVSRLLRSSFGYIA